MIIFYLFSKFDIIVVCNTTPDVLNKSHTRVVYHYTVTYIYKGDIDTGNTTYNIVRN